VAKIEKLGQKGKRFKKKKRVVETTRVHMRKLLIPQLCIRETAAASNEKILPEYGR